MDLMFFPHLALKLRAALEDPASPPAARSVAEALQLAVGI
jgi:hypothetical protein